MKIAAHHLNRRGGVIIGDVGGLPPSVPDARPRIVNHPRDQHITRHALRNREGKRYRAISQAKWIELGAIPISANDLEKFTS